jgi:hypothetical protein
MDSLAFAKLAPACLGGLVTVVQVTRLITLVTADVLPGVQRRGPLHRPLVSGVHRQAGHFAQPGEEETLLQHTNHAS